MCECETLSKRIDDLKERILYAENHLPQSEGYQKEMKEELKALESEHYYAQLHLQPLEVYMPKRQPRGAWWYEDNLKSMRRETL